MPPQDWLRVVSASVVPVVIISACGLLCLAFYNRLSSLVTRLRAFHRERLAEQDRLDRWRRVGGVRGGTGPDAGSDDAAPVAGTPALMLEVLEEQTAHLLRRARLIRSTLACLLSTIACLTVCSLLSGLSVLWPSVTAAAVAAFVAAMLLLLLGVVLAMLELRQALDPVELEAQFVAGLTEGFGPAPAGRGAARQGAAERAGNGDGNGYGSRYGA